MLECKTSPRDPKSSISSRSCFDLGERLLRQAVRTDRERAERLARNRLTVARANAASANATRPQSRCRRRTARRPRSRTGTRGSTTNHTGDRSSSTTSRATSTPATRSPSALIRLGATDRNAQRLEALELTRERGMDAGRDGMLMTRGCPSRQGGKGVKGEKGVRNQFGAWAGRGGGGWRFRFQSLRWPSGQAWYRRWPRRAAILGARARLLSAARRRCRSSSAGVPAARPTAAPRPGPARAATGCPTARPRRATSRARSAFRST